MSIQDIMKGGGVVETLTSMAVMLFQLVVMVTIKAIVYVVLVKLYKYGNARFFPDEVSKDDEKNKHLFDYESEWESEEEFQTADKNKTRVPEPEKMDKENEFQDMFIPDDELKTKTDELVSNLRERKTYKQMTAADFEKLKLNIPVPKTSSASSTSSVKAKNSLSEESKAHCKEA